MSHTATGQTVTRVEPTDLGLLVSVRTEHRDKLVQCYVSGELAAVAQPVGGTAEFALPAARPTDVLLFVAVSPDDAETDVLADAFPTAAARGNRIVVKTPQAVAPHSPGDRWRVFRGNAGAAAATIPVHDQQVYPGGRRACGFGAYFGAGGFGWDGRDAKGFGHSFGLGEFGFDCEMLAWVSGPLPPGDYPVKAQVTDAAGNESVAAEATVTLNTYARPASGLAIDSYDKNADVLALSFAPSEDLT